MRPKPAPEPEPVLAWSNQISCCPKTFHQKCERRAESGKNLKRKMCTIFTEVTYGVRVIYVILISRMSCWQSPPHPPSSPPPYLLPAFGIYDLWRIAVIFMFLQVIEINFALFSSFLEALLLLLLSPCRLVALSLRLTICHGILNIFN